MSVPPRFASAEQFRAALTPEVGNLGEVARKKLAAPGRPILGVKKVRNQSPFARPRPGEPRFGLKPAIAALDLGRRIEALRQLKNWRNEYRAARDVWCAGVRDVLFPAGTYLMRVLHGALCAGAA